MNSFCSYLTEDRKDREEVVDENRDEHPLRLAKQGSGQHDCWLSRLGA
jgi:hypothetical protein